MASSEKLVAFEPWAFRNLFSDSWLSEAIGRDSDVLTRALQISITGASTDTVNTSDTVSPLTSIIHAEYAAPTPTGSVLSGLDHESAPKRQRNPFSVLSGKVQKRKSRASKKSQTTFFTADPANFRQMVQQVTGVRFIESQASSVPVLEPEPHKLVPRLPGPAVSDVGSLPTLDTSAFMLTHHQRQQLMAGLPSAARPGIAIKGVDPLSLVSPDGISDGSGEWDFDTFPCFPTLESWKVM